VLLARPLRGGNLKHLPHAAFRLERLAQLAIELGAAVEVGRRLVRSRAKLHGLQLIVKPGPHAVDDLLTTAPRIERHGVSPDVVAAHEPDRDVGDYGGVGRALGHDFAHAVPAQHHSHRFIRAPRGHVDTEGKVVAGDPAATEARLLEELDGVEWEASREDFKDRGRR